VAAAAATFFERQHAARKHSHLFLALFGVAVAGTVIALDVLGSVTWMAMRLSEHLPLPGPGTFWGKLSHVPVGLHVFFLVVTLVAIFAVSAWKTMELREGGGAAVAKMMGGRGIGRGTDDPREKRLLNVVEEMSIAAGTRLPLVFVLDEQRGINAFSAGDDPSRAAIVVTRGTLDTLTRDELQGVIGHEFSHIVNGDMALNMRIIGILAGIVFIGAAGQFAMRASARVRDARVAPVIVVGALVFLIGSVGLFFSRVIKSMVARQREYLADASSVQFTRHAEPLAGALDQIRTSYSWIAHRHVEDVSHLFFADPHGFLSEPFYATHPPIEERIRRVDARFAADAYRRRRSPFVDAEAAAMAPPSYDAAIEAEKEPIPWRLTATQAAALVGTVQAPHLESAREMLRSFSPELRSALDSATDVSGVMVALLIARDGPPNTAALKALEDAGMKARAQSAAQALPLVQAVALDHRLAVADLALPTLRTKPEAERNELLRALDLSLAVDEKLSVYRFAFVTFVRSQLAPRKGAPMRLLSIARLRDEAALLVSLMAHAGCGDPANYERDFVRAFEAGVIECGLVGQVAATRREACTPEAASRSLERLQDLAPLDKARLVKGLFAAMTADGVIRPVEETLLRMVGGVLDCPLPPLAATASSAGEADAPRPAAIATA
jgi:Zn-dependent protease with chaperone function